MGTSRDGIPRSAILEGLGRIVRDVEIEESCARFTPNLCRQEPIQWLLHRMNEFEGVFQSLPVDVFVLENTDRNVCVTGF